MELKRRKLAGILIVLTLFASCERKGLETEGRVLSFDVIFDEGETKSGDEGPLELRESESGRILPMKQEVVPLLSENSTKGSLVRNDSDFIKEFGSFTLCVFEGGKKIIDNALVTYDQATSSWKLPFEYIWEWGKELEFIAWNNDGRLSVDDITPGAPGMPTIINFSCNSISSKTPEGTKDAMLGYYKGTGEKGRAKLQFSHLYSGMSFKISSSSDDFEEGAKVLSITLKDAIDHGTGAMAINGKRSIEWTESGTADYSQSFAGGISINEFNEIAENFLLPEYKGTMKLSMYLPSEGNRTYSTTVETPGAGQSRTFTIKRTGKAQLIHGYTLNNPIRGGFNVRLRKMYPGEKTDSLDLGNTSIKKIRFETRSSVNTGVDLTGGGSDYRIMANVAPDGTAVVSTPAEKIYVTAASQLFDKMSVLEEIEGLEYLDTRESTGFLAMFRGCAALKKLEFGPEFQILIPTVQQGPVSFLEGCKSLTSVDMTYPFSDLSGCRTLRSFFSGCTNLKSITMPESLNTSNIVDMCNMFSSCSSLSDVSFLADFDTRNVTIMNRMFGEMHAVSSLDLSNFDTRKVQDMNYMFCHSAFKEIDLSSFSSESLTSAIAVFALCPVTSLSFPSTFTLQKVKDMNGMFSGCSKLTSLNLSGFSPDELASCKDLFNDCGNLSEIDFGQSFTPLETCLVTDALKGLKNPATIKCNTATKALLDTDTSGRDSESTTFITY